MQIPARSSVCSRRKQAVVQQWSQTAGRAMADAGLVSLDDVAYAAGVSYADLAEALRHSADVAAPGLVAAPAEKVAFEASAPTVHRIGKEVSLAVVSLAARPGVLDGVAPKCLTPVGEQPLIGHVLTQLHAGGIQRCIIVLGVRGDMIRSALMQLEVATRMQLLFVDLGPGYTAGFAVSLIAASAHVSSSEEFLLCTPDHIFDAQIIRQLCDAPAESELDATVMVEADLRAIRGSLPPTAVRVSLSHGRRRHDGTKPLLVSQIGRHLGLRADGIEAGLYRCRPAIFSRLAELHAASRYFSVAQAMQRLADAQRLGAALTDGRPWYAFETRDQLEKAMQAVRGGVALFPWRVTIARADSFSGRAAGAGAGWAGAPAPAAQAAAASLGNTRRRLVLALPDAGASPNRVGGALPAGGQTARSFALLIASASATSACGLVGLTEPLLPSASATTLTRRVGRGRRSGAASSASSLEASSIARNVSQRAVASSVSRLGEATMQISIEMAPSPRPRPGGAGSPPQRHGYLLGLPAAKEGRDGGAARRLVLALPAEDDDEKGEEEEEDDDDDDGGGGEPREDRLPRRSPKRRGPSSTVLLPCGGPDVGWPRLPSSVERVSLHEVVSPRLEAADAEAAAGAGAATGVGLASDGTHAAALTVHKRVPPIGWLLLAGSLVTCYSGGAATGVQSRASLDSAHSPLDSPGGAAARPRPLLLHSAWRGMCSGLLAAALACASAAGRRQLGGLAAGRPPAGVRYTQLACAGGAYVLNFAAFNAALERTSISHAALFESAASLWLVGWAALRWACATAPPVPAAHAIGVLLGVAGAFLTTRDAAPSSPSSPSSAPSLPSPSSDGAGSVTAVGDVVAALAGVGAAAYLTAAERARLSLQPLVFFAAVQAQFCAACLAGSLLLGECDLSFDADVGAFGWLQPLAPRLPVQLYLALVVDLLGNLGFLVTMKYVPAITVAAAMLLGPLTATAEGMLLGVESAPGAWTVAGGALIIAGSGIISFSTRADETVVHLG